MRRLAVISLVLVLLPASPVHAQGGDGRSCVGLSTPVVGGEVVEPFAPTGEYSGHWGVDYTAPTLPGEVRAVAGGRVTFSGVVVSNSTITLDHGGGLRTSYSYVAERLVSTGEWVRRGSVIARAMDEETHGAVHLSLRIDGVYVDPLPRLGCRPSAPSAALSLVTPPG